MIVKLLINFTYALFMAYNFAKYNRLFHLVVFFLLSSFYTAMDNLVSIYSPNSSQYVMCIKLMYRPQYIDSFLYDKDQWYPIGFRDTLYHMLTKPLNKAIIALTKFSLNKHCINLALEKRQNIFCPCCRLTLALFTYT